MLDLGLWDTAGYRAAEGFRGWSGSRAGRQHQGEGPIWIETGAAARCYRAGPIEPGVWWIELGAGEVSADGSTYTVTVAAWSTASGGTGPAPDPVDAGHVARAEPGWYHADLHQHGRHSHPRAPEWDEFVARSRAAGLDLLPVVDYVTPWHWDELGAVQRANPDLLVWPGREVITYFGHAVVLGETRGLVEYRHGFEDVDLGTIQRAAVDAGALFQVAHPTTYPEALFGSHCRGCEFTLDDAIDWDLVTSIEVLTGPILLGEPPDYPNPFVRHRPGALAGPARRGSPPDRGLRLRRQAGRRVRLVGHGAVVPGALPGRGDRGAPGRARLRAHPRGPGQSCPRGPGG